MSEIRSTGAAAALGALAVASGAVSVLSPLIAVAAAPLIYGLTDLAAGHALSVRGPSLRVRIIARALASAAWGGSITTIVASRGVGEAPASRLPLLAIVLAVGTVIGVYGSGGQASRGARPAEGSSEARPPFTESPLIGLLDVVTAAWAFVGAVTAHGGDLRARVLLLLGVAVSIALRALIVARIAAHAARAPDAPGLAAIGFVLWVALAGIACTIAATPMTWSGLGAALILTLAAAIAETRKRRPLVVFLRGSLAFAFAAMLGVVTFLVS
jgi:hypothetical protein